MIKIHGNFIIFATLLFISGVCQNGLAMLIGYDGSAEIEILDAGTNYVVYKHQSSGENVWNVEAFNANTDRISWTKQFSSNPSATDMQLSNSVSFVAESRLLNLDIESGTTNWFVDLRSLDWPVHTNGSIFARMQVIRKGINRKDVNDVKRRESQDILESMENLTWNRIYSYRAPLLTDDFFVLFRYAADRGGCMISEYFSDWMIISLPDGKTLANGNGAFQGISETWMLYNSFKEKKLFLCEIDNPEYPVTKVAKDLKLPRLGQSQRRRFNSTENNLPKHIILSMDSFSNNSDCYLYNSFENSIRHLNEATNNDDNSIWITANKTLLRHSKCASKEYPIKSYSFDGKHIASRYIPKTPEHVHYCFQGVTDQQEVVLFEHKPSDNYGYIGGERSRIIVLTLPDLSIRALHSLKALGRSSDVSFGVPEHSIIIVGFGDLPIIKKMKKDTQLHSFFIQAIDIYSGEVLWEHEIKTTIKKFSYRK